MVVYTTHMSAAHQIAARCLLMRSRRLSRLVTRLYLERMQAVDLNVAQFTLLAAIGTQPGARATDLVPALDLEKSTVSRELGSLLAEGMVEAEAVGGRSLGLRLTDAGRQRLEEALPAWEEAQAAAERELGALGPALLAFFEER